MSLASTKVLLKKSFNDISLQGANWAKANFLPLLLVIICCLIMQLWPTIPGLMVLFPISALISAYLAVDWHRLIILEGYPEKHSRPRIGEAAGYIWRSFILVLIMLLASAPAWILFLIFLYFNFTSIFVNYFLILFIVLFMKMVGVQFLIYLPAYAVKGDLSPEQSYFNSRPCWIPISIAFACIFLADLFIDFILNFVRIAVFPGSPLMEIIQVVYYFLMFFMGVAVLSRAYLLTREEKPAA